MADSLVKNDNSYGNDAVGVGRLYIDQYGGRNDPTAGVQMTGKSTPATVGDVERIVKELRDSFSNYIEIQRQYMDRDSNVSQSNNDSEDDDDEGSSNNNETTSGQNDGKTEEKGVFSRILSTFEDYKNSYDDLQLKIQSDLNKIAEEEEAVKNGLTLRDKNDIIEIHNQSDENDYEQENLAKQDSEKENLLSVSEETNRLISEKLIEEKSEESDTENRNSEKSKIDNTENSVRESSNNIINQITNNNTTVNNENIVENNENDYINRSEDEDYDSFKDNSTIISSSDDYGIESSKFEQKDEDIEDESTSDEGDSPFVVRYEDGNTNDKKDGEDGGILSGVSNLFGFGVKDDDKEEFASEVKINPKAVEDIVDESLYHRDIKRDEDGVDVAIEPSSVGAINVDEHDGEEYAGYEGDGGSIESTTTVLNIEKDDNYGEDNLNDREYGIVEDEFNIMEGINSPTPSHVDTEEYMDDDGVMTESPSPTDGMVESMTAGKSLEPKSPEESTTGKTAKAENYSNGQSDNSILIEILNVVKNGNETNSSCFSEIKTMISGIGNGKPSVIINESADIDYDSQLNKERIG